MSEWETHRLDKVITIKHGFAFKGKYFSSTTKGPIVLTPGNFAVGGGFKDAKPKYYTGEILEEYILSPGDLVVTMTDLSKAGDTLGNPAIIPEGETYLHNQRIGLVETKKPELATKNFLNYALRTRRYRNYIIGTCTGSTVKHTSPKRIGEYDLQLPDLKEQESIAATLGALDDKIAVNERIISSSNKLCEALHHELHNKSEKEANLGEVTDFLYGRSLPKAKRTPGKIPVYGSGGQSGTHIEALVAGPGIIIGRKGTVGSVYWSEDDFFPIDTTFYASIKSPSISLEYLYFTLSGLRLESMNSDSAVPGLNRSEALAKKIRIPESESLYNFTKQTREMFSHIHSRRSESRTLAELRDTLLPQLMSGKLRVKDAEKIVEDNV